MNYQTNKIKITCLEAGYVGGSTIAMIAAMKEGSELILDI